MEKANNNPYKKLALALLVSSIIMYLVMFFNVDRFSHIYLSYTRLYMTLIMVSAMTLSMMLVMRKMYPNKKLNLVVTISSVAVFVFALTALRSQAFINDVQYMKAMIPHHSSAIMTSEHANIKDPELRRLSDSIIKSQEDEILQMKQILGRLK